MGIYEQLAEAAKVRKEDQMSHDEGLEQFSFIHEGELLTGYITQYETETVDVYVQSTGKYYEVPVNEQRSFRGCKLREFGDLSS